MNNVNIIGNLTDEPRLRTTPDGINFVGFTVAVDRPCGKDGVRRSDFFDCIAWRRTAEFICKAYAYLQVLRKGAPHRTDGCPRERDVEGHRRKDPQNRCHPCHRMHLCSLRQKQQERGGQQPSSVSSRQRLKGRK